MFTDQPVNRVWTGLLLVFFLAMSFLIGGTAQAQQVPPPPPVPDKPSQIKILLKERRDTLKKVVDHLMAQYKAGLIDFRSIVLAERDVLRATLDLGDNMAFRRNVLEEYLELAKHILKMTEDRFKAGQIPDVDVLQAKAFMLEVQIDLLRMDLPKPGK